MALLRRADLLFEADDLHAVLAQRAVHRRAALDAFAGTLQEHVRHVRVHAQVRRAQHLDLRMARGQIVGGTVDALDQHAVEQEIRQHDDAPVPEPSGGLQAIGHQRARGAGIADEGGAEAHALFQHARQLGDLGVGVGSDVPRPTTTRQVSARDTVCAERPSASTMRSRHSASSLGCRSIAAPKRKST